MQFPANAITSIIDTTGIAGSGCSNFISSSSSSYTLLYGQILTDNNTYSKILIGSSTYLQARADRFNPTSFAPVVFKNQAVSCTRPKDADSLFTVVYVPYDLNNTSSTQNIETQAMSGGFTYGEIIISLFVFAIFTIIGFRSLHDWVLGVKIKQ